MLGKYSIHVKNYSQKKLLILFSSTNYFKLIVQINFAALFYLSVSSTIVSSSVSMKKNPKKSIKSFHAMNADILDLTILDFIEKLVYGNITFLQNHLYHYSHFHHFFFISLSLEIFNFITCCQNH